MRIVWKRHKGEDIRGVMAWEKEGVPDKWSKSPYLIRTKKRPEEYTTEQLIKLIKKNETQS